MVSTSRMATLLRLKGGATSWMTQRASARTALIARHMTTTAPSPSPETLAKLRDASSPVQLLSDGTMRIVQLNREKALNAINMDMIDLIEVALADVVPSPNAATVLFRGVGRSICAGGDIMSLVKAANSDSQEKQMESVHFFQKELRQNWYVHTLRDKSSELGHPKTYIGLWDGIIMGGGVGMTVHGSVRIASERTLFAMPETGIGYFPDVGLLHTFSRLDGAIGMYLGLTGARLSGADVYLTGLATHYVRSSSVDELVRRLSSMPIHSAAKEETIVEAINEFASDPFQEDEMLASKSVFLGDRRIALDFAFSRGSVEQILAALDDMAQRRTDSYTGKELQQRGLSLTDEIVSWASETHATLLARSPRALKVTFRGIQLARDQTLAENMHMNLRVATAFCDLSIGRDFYTGVMHVLGRDPKTGKRNEGNPAWEPSRVEDVSDEYIQTMFFGDHAKAQKAGLRLPLLTLDNVPAAPKNREGRQARDAEVRGVGPLRWNPKHNPHALPSEAELAALYEGSHPAAGSYVLEPQELLDTIAAYRHNKPTLRLKVQDWLDRRARASRS